MREPADTAVAAGKASMYVSIENITTLGLGAILFAVYSRVLTVNELGVLATILLVTTIFQYVGQFGLNLAAASLIPAAMVDGEEHARRVMWTIVILTVIFGAIATLAYFLLAETFASLTGDLGQVILFQVASIFVFADAVAFTCDGLTQGVRNFLRLSYAGVSGQVVRVVTALILLFMGYRVLAIVIAGILGPSGLISIIVEIPSLVKQLPFAWPRLSDVRHVLRTAIPLNGVSLLTVVSTQLDLGIMVLTTRISQVAVYSVVLTISQMTTSGIILPLNASLIPHMTKIYKEKGKLIGAFEEGSRFVSIVSIPIALGLFSISPLLVRLVSGSKYLTAAIPLSIVMLSLVPYAFFSLVRACLQARGHNTQILQAVAVSVGVEGVLALLMAPRIGAAGAAISRLSLYITMLVVGTILLQRVMGLKVEWKLILRLTIASCAFLLIPILTRFWKDYSGEAVSIVFATVLFLVLIKLLKPLRKRDVTVLLQALPGRISTLLEALRIDTFAYWLAAGGNDVDDVAMGTQTGVSA